MNQRVVKIVAADPGKWRLHLACGHSVEHTAKTRPGSARVVWCNTCPPAPAKRK